MIMEIGPGPSGAVEIAWQTNRMILGGDAPQAGPAPLIMMLSALGACTLEAALAYCRGRGLEASGLRLEQRISFSDDGNVVEGLEQCLLLSPDFPQEARRPLLWMARNCPAKQLLNSPPEITLNLA